MERSKEKKVNMRQKVKYIHYILVFLGISFLSIHNIYGQKDTIRSKRFNYLQRPINVGFKAGLNAMSTTSYEAFLESTELANTSYVNKTGYTVNIFFRINLDRFFMQPEVEWNLYKQNFSFSTPASEEETWNTPYNILKNTQVASVNILVGYNIIKNGPYVFNAYAGPSFKYNYHSEFKYLNNKFRHYGSDYNSYGVLGFSFNILRFHVDVRYQIKILNKNTNFNDISSAPEELRNISVRKNENILGISCGMMF